MRGAVAVAAAAILLAGCGAAPPALEAPTSPIHTGLDDAPDDIDKRLLPFNTSAVEHVEERVELRVFQGRSAGASFYSGTANCASLRVDRVLNGAATAIWQSPPVMDTVEMRIRGTYVAVSVVGASPLQVPLEHGFADDGYTVSLHAPQDTILIDQRFEVTLDFHHVGGSGRVETTSC